MISETAVSSSPIIIQAPIENVWQVLIDFPNYINWNQFNPGIQAQLSLDTPVDANSCKYWSVDEFSGVGMAAMLAESGPAVEAGFELAAECLKQHCEALVKATNSH